MAETFRPKRATDADSPARQTRSGRRAGDRPVKSERIRVMIVDDHQVVADALVVLLNQQRT